MEFYLFVLLTSNISEVTFELHHTVFTIRFNTVQDILSAKIRKVTNCLSLRIELFIYGHATEEAFIKYVVQEQFEPVSNSAC